MITYVHYWYHAPGSSEGVEIAVDRWPDKTPQDVLPLIGSVGGLTTVAPDDRYTHGDTRQFKVLDIKVGPFMWVGGDMQTISNMLIVAVTEPA